MPLCCKFCSCVIQKPQLTLLLITYMSSHRASNCCVLNVVFCNFTDKQSKLRDSLLQSGLVLAKDSVAAPTQRSYNSTWKKWVVFMQTCHHNPTAAYVACTNIDHDQLLQLLLMFVSYVVDIIQKAPTSVPSILSALRYQLTMKRVCRTVTV